MRDVRYLKYLVIHKWFVLLASIRLGVPLLGLVHDWSKFLPGEWLPYRENFFGPWTRETRPQPVIDAFMAAWRLHCQRNKHHPEYWNGQPVPERYAREMVADWMGAGKAINGHAWKDAPEETRKWWANQKEQGKVRLHPETVAGIDSLMKEL